MTDNGKLIPLDMLIDTGLVLLGTARDSTPAEQRSLIGAVGVLFARGAGKAADVVEVTGLIEAPGKRKLQAPKMRRKPAASKPPRQQRTKKPPTERKPPATADKPAAVKPAGAGIEPGQVVEHHGVTISLLAGEEKVTFGELEIEVKPKQARLVACLAAANFLPVARDFIAKKVWAGERIPEFAGQMLGGLCADTKPALEQLGLTIKTVHGIGFVLQKVEA